MANQAINLTVCKCEKGASPSLLIAARNSCFKVGGQIGASISDTNFALPFGVCSITNSGCAFVAAGPWSIAAPTFMIGGEPTLVKGAKLTCAVGGTIDIEDVIQTAVEISQFLDKMAESLDWSDADVDLMLNGMLEAFETGNGLILDQMKKDFDKISDEQLKKWGRNLQKYQKIKAGLPGVVLPVIDFLGAETNEERVDAVGRAIGGAAGGAAGGAIGGAIGSIVPGPGTAIGAAIGATVGSTVGSVVGGAVAEPVADAAGAVGGAIKDGIGKLNPF